MAPVSAPVAAKLAAVAAPEAVTVDTSPVDLYPLVLKPRLSLMPDWLAQVGLVPVVKRDLPLLHLAVEASSPPASHSHYARVSLA